MRWLCEVRMLVIDVVGKALEHRLIMGRLVLGPVGIDEVY